MRRIQSKETEEEVTDSLPTESENSEEPSGISDARDRFLGVFATRFNRYLLIVILLGAGIAVIDLLYCGSIPNQILGLTIDIFGAIVLGRGVLKGPYTILGSTGLSSSGQMENNLIQSAVDGVFGIFFLVVGFLLQIGALIGIAYPLSSCVI